MARPLKEGLDYFPVDCVMDDKIEALEAEYGIEGFGVFIRVLQSIYRTPSGELNLNSDGFSAWKILGKRTGNPEEYLRKIIPYMVGIGLFDKTAYAKRHVLTSNGIKKRFEHVDDYRRRERERKQPSELSIRKTLEETGESKVKESKVKKIVSMGDIPPKIDDVITYCQERKNGVDPQKWHNHYQAKGWMIGKSKMKDWQAAVRTWERSNAEQPKQPFLSRPLDPKQKDI